MVEHSTANRAGLAIRAAIVSDTHFEHGNDPLDLEFLAGKADVLIAAGDIADGTRGIDWLATCPIPVVYVVGNHELYRRDAEKGRAAIAYAATQHPHIHVLDDDWIDLDFDGGRRARILGGTLWTDYRFFGEKHRARSMLWAARGINDHRTIRHRDGLWSPADAADAFERTREFLASELAKPFDGDLTIVVTHHAPTPRVVEEKHLGSLYNASFASDLEDLFPLADAWVYGHTHWSTDMMIDGCRVVSNQHGYSWESKDFEIRIFDFVARGRGGNP